MLLSDTSFWCRDAYEVEMVKARNSCLHIPLDVFMAVQPGAIVI